MSGCIIKEEFSFVLVIMKLCLSDLFCFIAFTRHCYSDRLVVSETGMNA